MPNRIPDSSWNDYWDHRRRGRSKMESARRSGISYSAAMRVETGRAPSSNGAILKKLRNGDDLPDIVPAGKMNRHAQKALEDFGYFRRRYFGRIATPWQEEAAYTIAELLESPHKEYVVENCPPGVGKSTTFTHDIPVWLACRNRSIRCLIGSRTERQAKQYTRRILRSFERSIPVLADSDELAKGRALNAEATLVDDFGRFKPANSDLWRTEEFVIAQPGDVKVEDKEASFAAYGMDSGFLGGRYDLVIWDDLVDKRTMRTVEARETLINWWETEAETRLEPGGLLLLQGQRMGAEDLYRYALDLKAGGDDEDEESSPKYRHIIFRAHYEDRCQGEHKPALARAYPDGCLLDPVRLPWRELRTIRGNRAERFLVLYQQEDTDPTNALVNPLWINGGRGVDGIEYPGCWDHDRRAGTVPEGLRSTAFPSVLSVDPSPSKWWGIEWWIHHTSELRYLIDLHRDKMEAPEFFHHNPVTNIYSGLLVTWWERSKAEGNPIRTLIIENNAAQRFMLQDPSLVQWCSSHDIHLRPHTTARNKSDPEFGVQMLAPHYEHGRIRLPGNQNDGSRARTMKLVDEVTKWPEGSTDDLLMSQWFFEHAVDRTPPKRTEPLRTWKPTWSLIKAG